jgi:hypothetical protein
MDIDGTRNFRKMSLAELQDYMEESGLPISNLKTKNDYIQRIEEAERQYRELTRG